MHSPPFAVLLFAAIATLSPFGAAPRSCLSAEPPRPISLHPRNGHYFLWRGKPTVIITSGEHYGALLNLDFDYVAYFDALKADGLNGTRTWSGAYAETSGSFKIARNTLDPAPGRFICPWARSATPGYADGGNKFDLTKWDDAYFRRLKDFAAKASERGIVVEMNLFCPMYEESMWSVSPMNAANNVNGLGNVGRNDIYSLDRNGGLLAVQEIMVKRIVQELKDFDNVYYEICNEPYVTKIPDAWQRRIADVIIEAQKGFKHPFLISQNIANNFAKIENPHPAVSIFNFHYATPPDAVAANYHLGRVIGDNETGFRGTGDAPYRTEAWDFIIAGGGLFNHLDYSFTVQDPRGTWTDYPTTQPGGGNPTLRKQFKILREFINGFDFIRMRPDNSVIKAGVPGGGTARALVDPGCCYAIYVRDAASTGPYSVRWTGFVEPRKTAEHTFHTFSNDGVRLWIDGRLVIDDWSDHSEKENTARAALKAGTKHEVKLEYFYNGGQGAAKLWWSIDGEGKEAIPAAQFTLPDGTGPGLKGEYFRGADLKDPWGVRKDAHVNFAWGTAAPLKGAPLAASTALSIELLEGAYKAEWVDTKTGAIARAEEFHHSGGIRRFEAPPYELDIALRIVSR